jgi:hypothetical protein
MIIMNGTLGSPNTFQKSVAKLALFKKVPQNTFQKSAAKHFQSRVLVCLAEACVAEACVAEHPHKIDMTYL